MEEGTLHFSVDARILRQLGQELVADRTTALAELVKNAYDADATRVSVNLLDPAEGGELEVHDDGSGMDLDTIRDCWMRLSTGNKERQPLSPLFRRSRLGRKGIGRFAAHTLGKHLVLSSTVSGATTRVIAEFDWDAFDQPPGPSGASHEVRVEEIGVAYRTEPAPAGEHGTTLSISGLRAAWGERDIRSVRRVIQLLQPPFPLAKEYRSAVPSASTDPGFEVTIEVSAHSQDEEGVLASASETDRFLEAATAVVSAEVAEDGTATWSVRSSRLDLDATATYPSRLLISGPFQLQASYFIHRRDALGDLNVKLARDMGNEYGGIRIYRDGLRVPSYGEPGVDWLRFDEDYRRREILYPIANINWFGHLSISRDQNVSCW